MVEETSYHCSYMENLGLYKRKHATIAKESFYSDRAINAIKAAKTHEEVDRLMKDARNGLI